MGLGGMGFAARLLEEKRLTWTIPGNLLGICSLNYVLCGTFHANSFKDCLNNSTARGGLRDPHLPRTKWIWPWPKRKAEELVKEGPLPT